MDADTLKKKQKNLIMTNLELATEIDKIMPKVAYYCRLYGIEQALNLGQKDIDPALKEYILGEFQELEKVKVKVGIAKESREADAAECIAFAKSIFLRATKMDRPDLPQYVPTAALTFKKAVKFFQVATQFGDLPEDCAKAKNYAATRCIALANAHKAGEAPPAALPQLSSFGEKEMALADEETAALMAELNNLPGVPGAVPRQPAAAFAAPPMPPPVTAAAPAFTAPSPTLPLGAVPATLPPRKFTIGQQVKFCPNGTVNCIKEDALVQNITIGADGNPAYRIYLTKRRQEVTAPGELLAPCLETGDKLVFYPEDGQGPEEVEVEEIYGSRWPPTYLIKRPGRGLVEAEDERLLVVQPTPTSATPAVENAGGAVRTQAESNKNADQVAELAAMQAVAAAMAAAEAEAEEKRHHDEDLSTIGEGTEAETEEHDGDGAKSTSSSVEAAKIVEHAMAAEKEEEAGNATAPAAPPAAVVAPPPPPSHVVYPVFVPPSAPVAPPPPPPPPPAPVYVPPPAPVVRAPIAPVVAAPAPPAVAVPASHALPIDPNYQPSLAALVEAQKVTKSAGSAMAFEDVPTAVKMLQDALHLLTRPGAKPSSSSSMKK
jgi:vacuolar protein sorting-associated protein VTA1